MKKKNNNEFQADAVISEEEKEEDRLLAEKYRRTIANKTITPGERKILGSVREV